MNKFDKGYTDMIFLGNGESSMAECFALVSALHKSLDYLSILHQGYDIDEGHREVLDEYVERTAKNIYTALTGKRP